MFEEDHVIPQAEGQPNMAFFTPRMVEKITSVILMQTAWAGNVDDCRSTSGYVFMIAGGPVSWRSKKQSSVALSTAEAEYMALASSA